MQTANVNLKANGAVEVNEHLQSVSAPHIYSAGDSTFAVGLVTVAEMEGRCVVEMLVFSQLSRTESGKCEGNG